jgi:hypothetical protein
MPNPLDTRVAKATTNNLRFPKPPSIKAAIKEHGFSAGYDHFDQQMAEYFQLIQRQIEERLQAKDSPGRL